MSYPANAGVSQKPIQKLSDVSQLFWMEDFGDNPPKLNFFNFLGQKIIFGVEKSYWALKMDDFG